MELDDEGGESGSGGRADVVLNALDERLHHTEAENGCDSLEMLRGRGGLLEGRRERE